MITRSAGQSQPTCHTYLLKIWREGDQEIEPLHAWRFTWKMCRWVYGADFPTWTHY